VSGQARVTHYIQYGAPIKTRTITLGPPVCAYCGEGFEGAYLHRRNADWHSGCWLQMSNDKYQLEEWAEERSLLLNLESAVHCMTTHNRWEECGKVPNALSRIAAVRFARLQTELQTNGVNEQMIPASSKDDAARPDA